MDSSTKPIGVPEPTQANSTSAGSHPVAPKSIERCPPRDRPTHRATTHRACVPTQRPRQPARRDGSECARAIDAPTRPSRPSRRAPAGARRAGCSRARRSRAACTRVCPSAARPAAISDIPDRRSRLSSVRPPRSFVGPVTMMRCASARNMSAPMPLICSSANSRSSYIQSCTSVRPSACVASTVTRLTRSLGNDGHSPVVIRRTRLRLRRLHLEHAVAHAALRRSSACITAATTSMSSSRAPSMAISPPVIAPTTAQLPASM